MKSVITLTLDQAEALAQGMLVLVANAKRDGDVTVTPIVKRPKEEKSAEEIRRFGAGEPYGHITHRFEITR